MIINAFKDKMVHAYPWAIADLERLVRHARFDARRLVGRLRDARATALGWIVADWMVEARGVLGWRAVKDGLGPLPPRAAYISAMRRLRDAQPRGAFLLRVLSRAASDSPRLRARALARMAWWQAEVWAARFTKNPFLRNDLVWLEPEHRPPQRPPERRG
jgi:hypothetical protein